MITALVLAACAQATPTAAPNPATQAPSTVPLTSVPPTAPPTATTAPTATTVPTTAPTAVPTSNIPTAEANTLTPNDATQARLRVSQCVPDEPDMDIVVNGKVLESSGVPMGNLDAGAMSRYEYLLPGTYRVAVVPSEMGIDQAFLAPLDVTLAAGHRYTLVVLGQPDEKDHPGLLIDETEAVPESRRGA